VGATGTARPAKPGAHTAPRTCCATARIAAVRSAPGRIGFGPPARRRAERELGCVPRGSSIPTARAPHATPRTNSSHCAGGRDGRGEGGEVGRASQNAARRGPARDRRRRCVPTSRARGQTRPARGSLIPTVCGPARPSDERREFRRGGGLASRGAARPAKPRALKPGREEAAGPRGHSALVSCGENSHAAPSTASWRSVLGLPTRAFLALNRFFCDFQGFDQVSACGAPPGLARRISSSMLIASIPNRRTAPTSGC
jgi:hypothetical protein